MRKQRAGLALGAALLTLPFAASSNAASAPPVTVYSAPASLTNVLGEPTIGADWRTGAVMYESGYRTYRIRLDSARRTASWTDVTSPLSQDTGGDPVLWVAPRTGRTVESQEDFTCSLSLLTDDDGTSWTPNEGCGAGDFADHQTIGGGPYAAPLSTVTPYPYAIYYCAQDGGFTTSTPVPGTAYCARSDDGGTSYGAGVPIYNMPGVDTGPAGVQCKGLHGKVRVSRDGVVYVPNKDCGGHVAVTVSHDNGTTWTLHPVPGSTTQDESDPAVAPGSGGTVYLAWEQGAKSSAGSSLAVAVSGNDGSTWSTASDLSSRLGLRNVQFPTVVAGDNDRAAVAFLGTTSGGDDQRGATQIDAKVGAVFPGVWHLYIAATTDRGKHWTTYDATPHDPVQRGCISVSNSGLLAPGCRNLLDYIDITIDPTGHALVAYTDGCIGECITHALPPNEVYSQHPDYRARHGSIARLNFDQLMRHPSPPG